ncbi:MAG: hypothetical protein R3293_05115 [Candidatus Promineifilaceae bacterium]|nr:hypothetical protein [Candidatus Promineifilaceae bacterium]
MTSAIQRTDVRGGDEESNNAVQASAPSPTSLPQAEVTGTPGLMVESTAAQSPNSLPDDELDSATPETESIGIPDSIELMGPPENSSFLLNTPITVYWDWPLALEDNQQFTLYLLKESEEFLVGDTAESSMGDQGYQLNFIPENFVNLEGDYTIQIRLEQFETSAIIAISKSRAVLFIRER